MIKNQDVLSTVQNCFCRIMEPASITMSLVTSALCLTRETMYRTILFQDCYFIGIMLKCSSGIFFELSTTISKFLCCNFSIACFISSFVSIAKPIDSWLIRLTSPTSKAISLFLTNLIYNTSLAFLILVSHTTAGL